MKKRMTALVLALLACLALDRPVRENPFRRGWTRRPSSPRGGKRRGCWPGGEYDAVAALVREDLRETITADSLRDLMLRQTEGAGAYRQVEDAMATGQTANGESFGVAVLYCEYTEDSVLFRLAFDPDMALIGLEVKKQ